MAIKTKREFRQLARLGFTTKEGQGIKDVQSALRTYNRSKTRTNLEALDRAVEAWFSRPMREAKKDLKVRSRRKWDAMISLRTEVTQELARTALPVHALPQLRARAKVSAGVRRVEQNLNLVYDMVYPDSTNYHFDYPIKFWLVIAGRSAQDKHATVVIPIKAHSGTTPHPLDMAYPAGMAGANLTPDVKKRWNTAINNKWGKVAMGVEGGNRRNDVTIDFRFEFVSDAGKAAAQVVCTKANTVATKKSHPSGTFDAVHWGAQEDGSGGPEHEVGHLIGNPDEYNDITYKGVQHDWGPGWQDGEFVMNNPTGPAHPRNYHYLGKVVAQAFGLTPANLCIRMNVGLSSTGQHIYKMSDHIWA